MINNTAAGLKTQIEEEVQQYLTEVVQVSDSHEYSQPKLVRRISLFENHIYPNGKIDKQGNYKFWFDVITSPIDSEVKNVDFDTKNIEAYSPRKNDELPCLIVNLRLKEFLRETGQAEEINSAIEEGSGWGNVVWKKTKEGYERVDLRNFYVINQTAFSLNQSPVIERHQFSQSDLRAKLGKWENVESALEECKSDTYKTEIQSQAKNTTVPFYDVFERNGEVSVKDLKETKKQEVSDGDENKYVFAKVISIGKSTATGVAISYIMFAEEMKGKDNSDIYEEFHRSRYKGRWWREGLYELLFDIQVRANQIGNQIALGLEFASKKIARTQDRLIQQNVINDMKNGDVIKSTDLQFLDMRMDGFDQLANDWNRLMELRNEIANSREIVQGITPASGTPLGTSQLLNTNAGKLFDFIREKLAIPFGNIFEKWQVPRLIDDIKGQDILRLTGDSDMMKRLQEIIVEDWYVSNLLAIGPHAPEEAVIFKDLKLQELSSRPQLLMEGFQKLFENFKPHVSVVITGEQINMEAELLSLQGFVALEQDPIRRTALIEMMMKKKGIDAGSLPKSPPLPQPGMQLGLQGMKTA